MTLCTHGRVYSPFTPTCTKSFCGVRASRFLRTMKSHRIKLFRRMTGSRLWLWHSDRLQAGCAVLATCAFATCLLVLSVGTSFETNPTTTRGRREIMCLPLALASVHVCLTYLWQAKVCFAAGVCLGYGTNSIQVLVTPLCGTLEIQLQLLQHAWCVLVAGACNL